jgi:hypothetical protein
LRNLASEGQYFHGKEKYLALAFVEGADPITIFTAIVCTN